MCGICECECDLYISCGVWDMLEGRYGEMKYFLSKSNARRYILVDIWFRCFCTFYVLTFTHLFLDLGLGVHILMFMYIK